MKFISFALQVFNYIFLAQGIVETKDLIFVILSQENKFNLQSARHLEAHICEQALALNQKCPLIYLSHEDFFHIGEWTILPILPKLAEIAKNSSWILFIEERTLIRLTFLLEALGKYDSSKNIWIGYGLIDSIPTIIHHFQQNGLMYPHLGAGIAITKPLVQRLSFSISKNTNINDFNIDKSFELALFVGDNGNGTVLTHDAAFCVEDKNEMCASFPKAFETCDKPVPVTSIYFGVKTCAKFHETRVPVVLNTWAKYAEKLVFFSDVVDKTIPTISLGIPNTESGHCGKTIAGLKYLDQKIENDTSIQWIIVVDDDTILSVSRLSELLSCYDAKDEVAIGERYGYGVLNQLGFNYITGGGGMVFSRALLRKLVKSCKCPAISAPDDMVVGHCLVDLGVSVTHSHLFHQARPMDYSPDLLKSDKHVSFHKHWMVDPIAVYEQWFAEEDSKLAMNYNVKIEL